MTISKNGFPPKALIFEALQHKEGHLNKSGVLCTYTGKHTGRSPNAKYFVKEDQTKDLIDWSNNQQIPASAFEEMEKKFDFFLNYKMVYTQNVRAVRDPSLALNLKITTEFAKHSLFVRNMFIPTNDFTSSNMTIEDRVGDAPNSSNNSLSYNMDEVDRETDVPS